MEKLKEIWDDDFTFLGDETLLAESWLSESDKVWDSII